MWPNFVDFGSVLGVKDTELTPNRVSAHFVFYPIRTFTISHLNLFLYDMRFYDQIETNASVAL